MALDVGLADLPVGVAARRDLRAVGHDQNLCSARQALQTPADGLGHGAADALIHLVEDHDRLALVLAAGQSRLHRQGEARQFPARGHRIQRAEGGPRIGRHLEPHRLDAQRAAAPLDRLQRHPEAGAFQLQRTKLVHDGGDQTIPRRLTRRRQQQGRHVIGLDRGGDVAAGLGQGLLAVLDQAQLLAQAHAQRRQGVDRRVQLAGGGAQGEQPLFRLVQTARLEVEGVGGGVDAGHRLGRLDQGAVHRLGGRGQFDDDGVVALGARLHRPLTRMFHRAQGRGQTLAQLVAAQQISGVGQIGDRLFRRAEDGAFARQLRLFVRLGIKGVKVGQIQRDFFSLGRRLGGRGLKLVQMGLGRFQTLGRLRHARQLRLQSAVVVEQGPVRLPVQQADRLMLAVHLDQQGADLAQGRHPGGLVVDIGAAATVGRDDPAQDQLLARRDFKAALGQQGDQDLVVGDGKDSRGGRLPRAIAHQPGVGTSAQRQPQSIKDDGLARPRLARQHGQAALDLQVQGVDKNDVADRERGQHGRSDSRFRRILARNRTGTQRLNHRAPVLLRPNQAPPGIRRCSQDSRLPSGLTSRFWPRSFSRA